MFTQQSSSTYHTHKHTHTNKHIHTLIISGLVVMKRFSLSLSAGETIKGREEEEEKLDNMSGFKEVVVMEDEEAG